MDPNTASLNFSVTNLVAAWDDVADGGGSFAPARAERVVERAVAAPERCDPAEPLAMGSAYAAGIVGDEGESWAERRASVLTDVLTNPEPDVEPADHAELDYDALRRRDIARELLRARLIQMAEQREHRSAYEIVFIILAAAVAILLAAPPLVQVLLAAHGVQG